MKTARFFSLALLLAVTSCAHTQVSPLQVSGTVIHGAKLAFVGTAAGIKQANEQHLLTAQQVTEWNAFAARFDTLYKLAADAWLAAAEKGVDTPQSQAAFAALQSLLSELTLFQMLLAPTPPPAAPVADGGTP